MYDAPMARSYGSLFVSPNRRRPKEDHHNMATAFKAEYREQHLNEEQLAHTPSASE